jgi:uroporphyrinogen-III synthase
MSFRGARVLSFESRRAKEIGELIRLNGGDPFVAPAMLEVPLEDNREALAFADRLYRNEFDMMIFLTGVGARFLQRVIVARDPEPRFFDALLRLAVVARGPKPAAVLREWGVPVAVFVAEPNTWRELLEAVADRPEHSVAIQEYGRRNEELISGLIKQGRTVSTVPVYQWRLPPDTSPLAKALEELLEGKYPIVLFTTAVQLDHFLGFAESLGKREAALDALQHVLVASIGPTCSQALKENGITPAMEPSHPKMGILVREAAGLYSERTEK